MRNLSGSAIRSQWRICIRPSISTACDSSAARFRQPSLSLMQRPETQMTSRLERRQIERFGERESLDRTGQRQVAIGRRPAGGDLAENVERRGLVAARPVSTGQVEGRRCVGLGLLEPPDLEVGGRGPGENDRLAVQQIDRPRLRQRPVKEGKRHIQLTTAHRSRPAKGGQDRGCVQGHAGFAEGDRLLEQWNRLRIVTASEMDTGQAIGREDLPGWPANRLGETPFAEK